MDFQKYIGLEVGGYQIQEIVGRGSFGVVFKAYQVSLQREVAIKVRPCPTLPDGSVDQSALQTIMSEAKLLGKFQHRNIVKVYNAGVVDNTFYLAMELLQGKTLSEGLQSKKPVNMAFAVHIAHEIASGLQAAHGKGIVHRDLKPSNVFLLPGNKVKILDFGLADAFMGPSLTESNHIEGGTPQYMAPEQWKRMPTDGRTDLYGLGVIIYRMLTGRDAWHAKNVVEWKQAHLKSIIPDVREVTPAVPEGLARLVKFLMQKDQLARPESAKDVLEYLQRLQHQHKELAPKGGATTVLCKLCETPNPQEATECSGCGEMLSMRGYSADELLPPEPEPEVVQEPEEAPKKKIAPRIRSRFRRRR